MAPPRLECLGFERLRMDLNTAPKTGTTFISSHWWCTEPSEGSRYSFTLPQVVVPLVTVRLVEPVPTPDRVAVMRKVPGASCRNS